MLNRNNNQGTALQDFRPVKIIDLEISQPLPEITSHNEVGEQIFNRVKVLARLHGIPLGFVELDFIEHKITPVQLAVQLWALLSEQINQHLYQDGLPIHQNLSYSGLTLDHQPRCISERQALREDAPMISIILATRDRVESLARTMESLSQLDYPRFEIILVDNAPKSEATYDFFVNQQARFTGQNRSLRYIREEIPGLAVAHNRGLQAVRGPIVAFTDDDVLVDKYWLSEILHGFKAADNVGCVTGLVIPLELQTPAQVLFEEFGGFTKGFTQQIFDLFGHRPTNPLFPYAAGRFGTGANMAFQTSLLEEAGGFDPALGIGTPALGADDMAAFFMTITRGNQLVYQPGALVFHQHRRTYEELHRQMYGYGVGLTAFLTKCLLEDPRHIPEVILKIPAGVRYAFSPASTKNEHKSSNYPADLELIELKGMLYGPLAYLRSRRKYRKVQVNSGKPNWNITPSLVQHYQVSKEMADYQRKSKTN